MLRTTPQSAASPSPLLPAGRDDCSAHDLDPPRETAGVVVADCDRFHAGFVAGALAEQGFNPVREAATAGEALALAGELDPQLVLVGALPEAPLQDTVRALSLAHPDAVILVTGDPSREEALGALAAGARGVVSKQLDPDAFTAVVRAAVLGQAILVSRELSDAVASALPPLPDPLLSRREMDVLALLVRGFDNAAIAAELHISASTAKGHVSHILAKLQSENRVDAALQGIRRGLVRP
jgi:DNA-binding NarL/FixJ family response regulator